MAPAAAGPCASSESLVDIEDALARLPFPQRAVLVLRTQEGFSEQETAAVLGIPVGFIGAAESKDALAASDLPHLVVRGRRGGSAMTAAAVNALASDVVGAITRSMIGFPYFASPVCRNGVSSPASMKLPSA